MFLEFILAFLLSWWFEFAWFYVGFGPHHILLWCYHPYSDRHSAPYLKLVEIVSQWCDRLWNHSSDWLKPILVASLRFVWSQIDGGRTSFWWNGCCREYLWLLAWWSAGIRPSVCLNYDSCSRSKAPTEEVWSCSFVQLYYWLACSETGWPGRCSRSKVWNFRFRRDYRVQCYLSRYRHADSLSRGFLLSCFWPGCVLL